MTAPDLLQVVKDYVEALRKGVDVDAEAWVSAHPELGPSLRAALAAARTVAALSAARRTEGRPERPGVAFRSRYEQVALLDRGGMGVVLRAHDPALGRDVALKTLPADAADVSGRSAERTQAAASRFRREARLTAALEHPGVPPVYEVGTSLDGAPYYAMRLVAPDRRTLADRIAALGGRRFEDRVELLDAFLRVCDTVAYAHAKGILHRDLKPENVVLGAYGVVFVVDWGLATWREASDPTATAPSAAPEADDGVRRAPRMTQLGAVLGTAGYLSPEAATGRMDLVDERSEVYSLGAMLFELLTGELPHPFATREEYIERVRTEPPRPATDLDATIPRPLAELCRAALSIDRSDRPESVEALADGVRRWRALSDADREGLRLISEARLTLGRVPALAPEEARNAVTRAFGILASVPALAAEHPELETAREECRLASARLDEADRLRWVEQGERRRRKQRRLLAVVLLLLLGVGTQRVLSSRAEGQAEARRDAVAARRASIAATIEEMRGAGSAGFANDLTFVLRLVRDTEPETVDLLVGALDAISDELATARERAASEPDLAALEEPTRARRAQQRFVPRSRQRLAQLLCEALGHTGMASRCAPALARHLSLQYEPAWLEPAGRALALLSDAPEGGEVAERALRSVASARGLDREPQFKTEVLSRLPGRDGGGRASRPLQGMPARPPRPPHGMLADPGSGADWMVPAYVESWLGIGVPRDGQREARDELRALTRSMEATPLDPSNWVSRAGSWRYAGALGEADADLTRALELGSEEPGVLELRADVRRLRGDFHGAIHDCSELIARAPSSTTARLMRGLAWMDLGDGARALEDFDAVLRQPGEVGAAPAYRAMARISMGDLAGAEADGLLSARLSPESAEGRNVLAVARLLQGRDAEALEAAEAAATHGGAYTLAWNTLGVARCRAGDAKGGRAALERAIRLDPELPFAWVNLGVWELRWGTAEAAEARFEGALERCEGRLSAPWLGLSIACRAQGDASGASLASAAFAELAPADPRSRPGPLPAKAVGDGK